MRSIFLTEASDVGLQVHEVAEGIMAWVLGASGGDANPHTDPAPAAADPARLAAAAAALLRSFEGLSPLEGMPNPGQTTPAPPPGAAEREPGEVLQRPLRPWLQLRLQAWNHHRWCATRQARVCLWPLPRRRTRRAAQPQEQQEGAAAPGDRDGAAVEDMREAHLACLAWLRALLQRRRPTDAAEQVQAALLAALLSAPQSRTPLARLPARRLRLQGVSACVNLALLPARVLVRWSC